MAEAIGKNGGPSDMMQAARVMAGNRNPQVSATGIQMLQSLQRLDAAKKAGVYGTVAPTAMPSVAPVSGALGSGTYDPNAPVAAPMPTQAQKFAGSMGTNLPPVGAANQLAPAPVAPVNQLVDNTAALRAEYAKLSEYSDLPGVKDRMDLIKEQLKESAKYYVVGGNLVTGTGKPIFTAPEKPLAPPSSVAEFERAQADPKFMRFLQDRAAATRAPVQPVAPTITQIVDPANPNQMISVDARRYKGGGVGSPGVIGVGGKEPGAALRVNKVEEGKTQLANDLDNLRSSFQELNRLRAIPSTERNFASNLMSAAQATGVGQALGRAGGTKEQVERDVINSARQRLVASIKNATGMSSKSLDSNVELQTMLRSISDPGQSVEAALRIIQDIEDAYVTGNGTLPKKDKPAPAATQGTGGFRYLGKESN